MEAGAKEAGLRSAAERKKFCCCACWMHFRFGAPRNLTAKSVSDFISPEWDVSEYIEELRPRELACVLLYEMLRDRERYAGADPPLSKAEQMFIVLAKNAFAKVTTELRMETESLEAIWTNSGLAIIYMNHEGCSV